MSAKFLGFKEFNIYKQVISLFIIILRSDVTIHNVTLHLLYYLRL